MKKLSLYGVEFSSQSELYRILGYSRALSINTVLNTYGSLENMTATRLKLRNYEEIAAKLQELKNRYQDACNRPEGIADHQNAIRALLGCFDAMQVHDRDLALNALASALNVSPDSLAADIDKLRATIRAADKT